MTSNGSALRPLRKARPQTRHLYRFFDLLLLERSLELKTPDNRRTGDIWALQANSADARRLAPATVLSRCLSGLVNVRKLLNLGRRMDLNRT